jgi:glutathione S-transferase
VRLGVADVDHEEHARKYARAAVSAPGRLKLYVVPASHPCAAVEHALKAKGLAYDRVDLPPVVHAGFQRLMFGKRTVPGLVLPDGDRVVGSRAILRVLDGLEPDPPLLPADVAARARVEGAEAWGERSLQPLGRRVLWAALMRAPHALGSYAEGASLPLPDALIGPSAPLVVRLAGALNRIDESTVRANLAALPAHLDRVDAWLDEGVLGGPAANVADLQVGSTLALLMTLGDLRPALAARRGGELALRMFPSYPGHVPAGTLPAQWLAPLSA